MKITLLIENGTVHEDMKAEHGLSVYIETKGRKILFDSGQSDAFLGNAEKLGIDLRNVDFAVASHGHYDHTGGFPSFLRLNEKAPLYIHENSFRDSHVFRHGALSETTSGIKWSMEDREFVKDRMILTSGPLKIDDDIWITGTVDADPSFVPTERFYYRDEDGNQVEDDMSHEQVLVIREEKGIYIFSGCSHRGVINALEMGKRMFPGETVRLFLAGMHLYNASEEDKVKVIDQSVNADIYRLMPVHCTGRDSIERLCSIMGERCIAAGAGDTYED